MICARRGAICITRNAELLWSPRTGLSRELWGLLRVTGFAIHLLLRALRKLEKRNPTRELARAQRCSRAYENLSGCSADHRQEEAIDAIGDLRELLEEENLLLPDDRKRVKFCRATLLMW
jgi:hypothetical protein